MLRVKDLSRFTSAALIIAVILAACSNNPLGPDGHFQVSSAADNFTLQMWNLEGAIDTRTYTWENTGTQAAVYVSGTISSGP